MKRVVTLILLFQSLIANAQEENSKKYTWGINLDQKARIAFYMVDKFKLPLSLFATLSNDKHQFEFGPQYYWLQQKQGFKIGLSGQYKYYPNGRTNGFNTYITPSIVFQYGEERYGVYTFDKDTQMEVYGESNVSQVYGYVGLGYGFEIKLTPKWYLGTDARGLLGYGNFKNVTTFSINPSLDNTYSNQYWNAHWQFGINIGCRF